MTDKQLEEMADKIGADVWEETCEFDGHKDKFVRAISVITKRYLKQIQTETAREIAEEVKNTFPKIHTHASENSDRYHIQDETCDLIATKIKTRYGLEE